MHTLPQFDEAAFIQELDVCLSVLINTLFQTHETRA